MTDSPDVARYADPVLAGSRAGIARAITLVESTRSDHRVLAQHVLNRLLPHADRARRVGVTGVPGVGKSTFIDVLGGMLIDRGHRVAVLAVDPSSTPTSPTISPAWTRSDTPRTAVAAPSCTLTYRSSRLSTSSAGCRSAP